MITAREQLAAKPGEKQDRAVRASFVDVNEAYETWLRSQCEVDETALMLKHCRMRESAFVFSARDFLSLGRRDRECPSRACRGPTRLVGRRCACAKLRHMARQGRTAGVGLQ